MFFASRTMPHGHQTTTEVIATVGTLQEGMGAHLGRVQFRDATEATRIGQAMTQSLRSGLPLGL